MVGPEAVEFVLSSHIEHFSWRLGWPDNFKLLFAGHETTTSTINRKESRAMKRGYSRCFWRREELRTAPNSFPQIHDIFYTWRND